ncbi:DUF397 domain-containing protein [Streptomyces sp. NPDC001678]|uniref:DUF397 domain-containing protein n=1 Tax=Streptomyces sp. NPDC001678 TaxID=3364599 RepID=UPI0036752F10
MSAHQWRKSSYSASSSNCVNIAAVGDGTLRLRESDFPGVILAPASGTLRGFLRAIKADRLTYKGER